MKVANYSYGFLVCNTMGPGIRAATNYIYFRSDLKSDLVPFIEAQWESYEGDNKIVHLTLESPDDYLDAFDFIPYRLEEMAEKLLDKQLPEFLDRYEIIILRHPQCFRLR